MGILLSAELERKGLERAAEIREELYSRIDRFKQQHREDFLSISQGKKKMIKQSSVTELTDLMDRGIVTSYEIVLVFAERTATIGVRNGYVMDEMFEEALQEAKEIDRMRKDNPKKKCWRYGDNADETFPPFFGVPVSIKESILYKGRTCYVGHVYPINPVPTEDPQIILLLRKMGLIPFVRSTVPQANKTIDTNNQITGYAKNPWNQTRTCGGSSGGQGGLVGGYCSPLGIGSDIAGSSRVPCLFTGIVTLKPFYRYSNIGNAFTGKYSGGLFLRPQITAFTHTVEDTIIWNQFMYDKANRNDIPLHIQDPYLKFQPFRANVLKEKKKFKIGYYTDFKGTVKCSPANTRAVIEAVNMLQSEGHTAVQIDIPYLQSLWMMLVKIWFSSKKLDLLNECRNGQKPIQQYVNAYLFANVPYFLKVIIALIIRKKHFKLSQLALNLKQISAKQYFHLMFEYQRKQKEIYQYLRKNEIDIILCPGFFMPAYKLGQSPKYSYCAGHSPIWSLLHYPAGVVPITTVREDELYYTDYHNDSSMRAANRGMKEAGGLPVGVQIVSYPGQEEEILYVMKQLEEKAKFREKYQCKTMLMDP